MSGDSTPPETTSRETGLPAPQSVTSAPPPAEELPAWAQTAIEEVARPLAIAAMLTCIAEAISGVARQIAASWPGTAFAVIVFLVSLEGIHAQRRLSRVRPTTEDRWRFHFVEIVVLLLVVRFGLYLSYGAGRLLDDLAAWTSNIGTFFDTAFVIISLIALGFWGVAKSVAQAIHEMETTPLERAPSSTSIPMRTCGIRCPAVAARPPGVTESHRGHLFWGGVVLLVLWGSATSTCACSLRWGTAARRAS